jgi:hypothetical protein
MMIPHIKLEISNIPLVSWFVENSSAQTRRREEMHRRSANGEAMAEGGFVEIRIAFC